MPNGWIREAVRLENGILLAAAEAAGFQAIVTTDQEIPYQQNLKLRRISILILSASTNRLVDLIPLMPKALQVLDTMEAGQVIRIG